MTSEEHSLLSPTIHDLEISVCDSPQAEVLIAE